MYFLSDIKNFYKNRVLAVLFFLLFIIAVADPISSYLTTTRHYEYYSKDFGVNPFQYWLFNHSTGWGYTIYSVIFWILPMFAAMVMYYREQNSSVEIYKICRKSKKAYYFSKIFTVFICTFLAFGIILLINVPITYIAFPNTDSITDQFYFYIPNEGTFAAVLYNISPILMCVVFCLLNAAVLAIMAVIYLEIHMIFRFKNQYIAMIIPVVAFYGITFLFDSSQALWHYDIYFIIQPMAYCATSEIVTLTDVIATYTGWVAVAAILAIIGFRRNRDML